MSQTTNQVITDGYKPSEVGIIPEEWKVKSISEAFEICNNLRFPLSAQVREKMTGDYPYYGPTKIQDYINEFRIEGEYALIGEDGDHFLKFETMPQTQLARGRFNVNNHAHVIKGRIATAEWFYLYFKHREITSHLSRQGAGRYKLNKATLEQLPCAIPPKEEQAAIANALSDVDALLCELEKLIAKKQAIKTATMQQLLSGQTRLPQFATYVEDVPENKSKGQLKGTKSSELGKIPEDWDIARLGGLTIVVGSGKTSTKGRGEFPLFGSTGQIGTCLNDDYNGDSLLVARVGANAGKLNLVSGRYGVSDNTIIIKLKKGLVLQFYKYQLIRKNLNSLVFGSGQPLITGSQLKNLQVVSPTTEEQEAIVNILSDMEDGIQALEQRLSKTRQIKQGMMQELLTGKTRLPFDKN